MLKRCWGMTRASSGVNQEMLRDVGQHQKNDFFHQKKNWVTKDDRKM